MVVLMLCYSKTMPKDAPYVIWPVYFDRRATRKQGRRVSKDKTVPNPRLDEIYRAAKKLNYTIDKEDNKAYPGRWWRGEGRILIMSEENKTAILHEMAGQIIKNREN